MALHMYKIPYLEEELRVIPNIEDLKMPGSKQIISQKATNELSERLREVTDEEMARRYYHEEEFIETSGSKKKQIVKRLVPNNGQNVYFR